MLRQVLSEARVTPVQPAARPAVPQLSARSTSESYNHVRAPRATLFLFAAVVFSSTPYVYRLGFYSDDWAFISTCRYAPSQSVLGYFRSLFQLPDLHDRPGQALLVALLYRSSGLHPLGYHLANTLIFSVAILLLYLVLRELRAPVSASLAVPLLYAVLPHFSTDHFWMATFQSNLSMTFCLLAFYAGLRSTRHTGIQELLWRLIGVVAIPASLLSYETTAGLLLMLPVLLCWQVKRQHRADQSVSRTSGRMIAYALSVLSVLSALIVYKAMRRTHFVSHPHFPRHALTIVKHASWEALDCNLLRYGFHLPRVLSKVWEYSPGVAVWLVAAALGAAIFLYFWQATARTGAMPGRRTSLQLVGGGFVVWSLGYGLFAPTATQFATTGVVNRVSNAAAVGTSFVLVGLASLVSAAVRSVEFRRKLFCSLIALLCVSYFLVLATLAQFWISAYQQQQLILSDIQANVRQLPQGSTLFLDGACPYVGPAVVFEAGGWDLKGAFSILYGDPSLRADVATRDLHVGDNTLSTYSDTMTYSYGPHVFVYHFRRKTLQVLENAQSARKYFGAEVLEEGCPLGKDGFGVAVF